MAGEGYAQAAVSGLSVLSVALGAGAALARRSLSERLDMTHSRLINWSRWARNDDPHIGYPAVAPGFAEMIYESTDREGWGSDSKEAFSPPPDASDARKLDVHIIGLCDDHFKAIKRHYYDRRHTERLRLDVALRALADRLYPVLMRQCA